MFRRFQGEELVGFGGVDDSTQVKLLLGSTESVRVRGRCLGKNGLSRCSGIKDSDSVPSKFVCQRCRNSNRNTKASGHCKDETVAVGSGKSLTAPFDVR
ncbi:phd finger protein [Quercus suber]|uniref:Phd finger protein n=1 Tax=Quercus suber TaxID=58331 RepID=A0AAW0KP54_QUESU